MHMKIILEQLRIYGQELKCKIYATPFTAALISEKFKEKKIDISLLSKIVPLNSKINLGKFEIDFVTLTHSILEPNGLCINNFIRNNIAYW